MATIAATAPETRTAVGSAWLRSLGVAGVMTAITVWLTCAPAPTHAGAALIHMPVVASAAGELVPRHVAGLFDGVIVPPAHPDARPWPHGMVIEAPRTNDRIQLAAPGALDSLVSALLAPWLAIAS